MHNMEGCFVTAPTTPWAGKELWYKQCGRAKYLPEEPPNGIVSCNIRWQELYVFLVYASRSLFAFLTTAAFRLSKGKGNRIIYNSGRQQNFFSGIFVGLHCLSFLRLIYPFSDSLVCNSVYRASFLFRTKGIYCISFHGQDMERTGKESYVARLIDPYLFLWRIAPFLACGSLEYQISDRRLQASYFLPGDNEFVLMKKAKKEKLRRKLSQWLRNAYGWVFFQYDVVVCQAADRVSKKLLQPDTRKIL